MGLKRTIVTLTTLFLGVNAAETYIVTLKPGASLNTHVVGRRPGFELKQIYGTVLNGYTASLSPAALSALKVSDDVESIEKDQIYSLTQSATKIYEFGTRPTRYLEKKGTGGEGVDIYIIDTGIRTSVACFGGRAVWGKTFGNYSDADGNGHGTALAVATLCSSAGGTATSAKALAVKVLSDQGSGAISDIISGVNWVASQAKSTGKPSIGVLSLGGSASAAMDNAVRSAISSGVHMVVTAGFSGTDVSNFSPARVAEAITVGAIPRSKQYPTNSNYGAGIDVWSFYPTTCPSDASGCNTPTNSVPYVAGYMAVAISEYGDKTPAALAQDLVNKAVPDVTGVPSGTTNRRAVPW